MSHKNLINSHCQCFCCGTVSFTKPLKMVGFFLRPPAVLGPINVPGYDSCTHGRNSRWKQRKGESRVGENEEFSGVLVSVCRSQGFQDRCLCSLRSQALTNQYAASGPHERRVQCALIVKRARWRTKLWASTALHLETQRSRET